MQPFAKECGCSSSSIIFYCSPNFPSSTLSQKTLRESENSPRAHTEMELGGNGGFHGYRRLPPPPNSAPGLNVRPDTNMGLPSQNQINNSTAADDTECTVREQDRFMPIANVIRIMRKILPAHAKISDDAKETIQECVSEYISFITGEANDRCQREQRKTITAEDVLWAMSKLGFDDYIEPLTMYLHRYREYDGGERGSIRGDPLVKRAVDPSSLGMPTYAPPPPPPGYHYAHHPAFYGPAAMPPMNGYIKDPNCNGASTSQAPVANHSDQTFVQAKE